MSLEEAVSLAKERIRSYSGYLLEDEIRTRIFLIHPVLDGAGWDIYNHDEVEIEARLSLGSGHEGRIDYLLKDQTGNPCIFIEAKKYGDKRVRTGILGNTKWPKYVKNRHSGIAVFTDGRCWRIYDLTLIDREMINDKEVAKFDIVLDSFTEIDRVVRTWLRPIDTNPN